MEYQVLTWKDYENPERVVVQFYRGQTRMRGHTLSFFKWEESEIKMRVHNKLAELKINPAHVEWAGDSL